MNVNIHYVTPHFHPDIGGVEDHVLRLGKFMVGRGHEVTVHTSRLSSSGSQLPSTEDYHGIHIKRYSPRLSFGYYATMFRPQIGSGHILHAHGYAFLPNDFSIRHFRGRMGTVMTTHHGVRMTPPNLRGRLLRTAYDSYGLRTLRRADRVLTSSEADRRWLVARDLQSKKVEVVPDGIDDDNFQPGDAGVAERFALGDYVMFLGRVHGEKNVDHLLTAVARLSRPSLQVAVVGPEAGASEGLKRLSHSLGISHSVKFLGRVPPDVKKGLLAGCRMLVLPSLYEAQGLVILEAWGQGRPIVASRVGGVPDMVKEGSNGLLYEWGDIDRLTVAIARILDDRDLASKLGEAGRATAFERYRWSAVAARIENIYKEVLVERPWRHKHK